MQWQNFKMSSKVSYPTLDDMFIVKDWYLCGKNAALLYVMGLLHSETDLSRLEQ